MSYFASSSSYSNTFLVLAFTISHKNSFELPGVRVIEGKIIKNAI